MWILLYSSKTITHMFTPLQPYGAFCILAGIIGYSFPLLGWCQSSFVIWFTKSFRRTGKNYSITGLNPFSYQSEIRKKSFTIFSSQTSISSRLVLTIERIVNSPPADGMATISTYPRVKESTLSRKILSLRT